jgi:FkbM family methyltransferase
MQLSLYVRQLFRSFGVCLHRTSYSDGVELYGNIRQLLKAHNINLVIDVGANKGQFRNALKEHCGYKGKVASFEPIPDLAANLKQLSASDSSWNVFDVALGSEVGNLEFDVYSRSELSSFLKGGSSLSSQEIIGRKTVPVQTIASLASDIFAEIPPEQTFLKMDTQGFDLNVMRGAGSMLRRFPFILTEVPNRQIYEGMSSFEDCINFLRENSFSPVGFWAVSRGASFEATEFDCLAVNVGERYVA